MKDPQRLRHFIEELRHKEERLRAKKENGYSLTSKQLDKMSPNEVKFYQRDVDMDIEFYETINNLVSVEGTEYEQERIKNILQEMGSILVDFGLIEE